MLASIYPSPVQFGEDEYSKTIRRGKSNKEIDKNWQSFAYLSSSLETTRVVRFLMCNLLKRKKRKRNAKIWKM
jgi:hypothetical protein